MSLSWVALSSLSVTNSRRRMNAKDDDRAADRFSPLRLDSISAHEEQARRVHLGQQVAVYFAARRSVIEVCLTHHEWSQIVACSWLSKQSTKTSSWPQLLSYCLSAAVLTSSRVSEESFIVQRTSCGSVRVLLSCFERWQRSGKSRWSSCCVTFWVCQ